MAIRRITISVSEEVAERIKDAAGDTPVSTWVTERIEEHLDDEELARRWAEFYRDVSPKRADIRRAERLADRLTKPGRRRGVA